MNVIIRKRESLVGGGKGGVIIYMEAEMEGQGVQPGNIIGPHS